MKNKFYITSAIPYVNAAPHIGHAQEFVLSDCIRRLHKLLEDETLYLCGADENGLKIVQAAEKNKTDPQKFCDRQQQKFFDLGKKLNVEFDVWQRGTNRKTHFPSSQKLWELCNKNGDIYKKTYTGLYCVGCELFYTEEELGSTKECAEHPGKKLEKITEENYFFRLSRYQSFIEDLIEKDKLEIIPDFRKNEALSFIKRGLEDFSISRSIKRAKNWGVPVPNDVSQIIYVWFDVLNIYQSGIGFGWDEKNYGKWSPQNLMIIGKGILRFHAVYWPAILKSAGLNLPEKLFVHGYLTVNGAKMSKTLGNVVDPNVIINQYGTDALRYYLVREIPSFSDGDFSERRFKEIYNSDLANNLGNLAARVGRLASKLEKNSSKPDDFKKIYYMSEYRDYKKAFEQFRLHDAMSFVFEKVRYSNKYIDENVPWKLEGEKLKKVLDYCINEIIIISTLLLPFMPSTADTIIKQFTAVKITSQKPLFPRIK